MFYPEVNTGANRTCSIQVTSNFVMIKCRFIKLEVIQDVEMQNKEACTTVTITTTPTHTQPPVH
jgi:hypothetical protein